MIIQNLKQEYEVVRIIEDNPHRIVYLCRYHMEMQLQMCEIIQLKNMGKNREVISHFNGIVLKGMWEDFMECFIKEESLYVVLKFHEGDKLKDRLKKEKFSLQERAILFEHICERIVLQNAPYYFLSNGLNKEHLVVDGGLNVYMQYDLAEVQKFYDYSIKEVCRALLLWMKLLFKNELKYKVCKQLIQFKKQLIQYEFTSCMELYDTYMQLKEELLQLYEGGLQPLPNTLPYRIWNSMKRGMDKVKYMLLFLLLVATIALSILMARRHLQKSNLSRQVVEYIGTIKIGGEE